MNSPPLSRRALSRVLQSLLTAELQAARGTGFGNDGTEHSRSGRWPEDLILGEVGANALGCDSLELLRVAAAANEMFCLYEAGLEMELFSARTFGGWLDVIEAAWRAGVARVTFNTSGSTGAPKRATHDFGQLYIEVGFLATLFGESRRVVALARAHHIYGFLFTAMLPDRLGVDVAAHDGAVRNGRLDLREGDLVVAIPELWSFLNRTVTAWPKHVDGVVSTGPCAPGLIGLLIEDGLGSMTEIYGSTETAGIGTRRWPELRYRLMPQWTPIRSNDPDRTDLFHASGRRVQAMDRLQMDEEGFFTIGGRLDGLVQVGGTNVHPAGIAALLAGRPGVVEAAVGLMRLSDGQRLEAYLVLDPRSSAETVRGELEVWIEQHLAAAERPKALTFVSTLP